MDSGNDSLPDASLHVAVIPYPGRGHINAMMNLCKLLILRNHGILITFIVTEEWLGFIDSEPKPENISFRTVPNVIPSEQVRANDFPSFVEAVNSTLLQAPMEQLLDRLEPSVTTIVADTYVKWAVETGSHRNIPVASLMPMSATMFSVLFHFDLLVQNHHFPVELSVGPSIFQNDGTDPSPVFKSGEERGEEIVDYIPGVSKGRLSDLPTIFSGDGKEFIDLALECVKSASKAQYLLFTSVYEIEYQVIGVLKTKLPLPIYTLGPVIPYFELNKTEDDAPNYLQWLHSQPKGSVLYISQGSFLSVKSTQLDEIVSGVLSSGVRFLWVARGESFWLKDVIGGRGLVVPWCEQLRVLCHPSVGAFWSHCGWNSTLEALYAGVPMLTFPIFWDQVPNSKQIVEDWKIGWRVKKAESEDVSLVRREEIAEIVRKFMDFESNEGKEMRKRAKQLGETCRKAIDKGGSSDSNLDAFLSDITYTS